MANMMNDTITKVHLHGPASPDKNSLFIFDWWPNATWRTNHSVYVARFPLNNLTILDWMLSGLTYVNIHSVKYPNGVARGQIGVALVAVQFNSSLAVGTGAFRSFVNSTTNEVRNMEGAFGLDTMQQTHRPICFLSFFPFLSFLFFYAS
jgi:hypothetical protein